MESCTVTASLEVEGTSFDCLLVHRQGPISSCLRNCSNVKRTGACMLASTTAHFDEVRSGARILTKLKGSVRNLQGDGS